MQTVVGVCRGGGGSGHEASLVHGASVLAALPEDRFLGRDFYIDREGNWFERGRKIEPAHALRQLDAAFVCLPSNHDIVKLVKRFSVPLVSKRENEVLLSTHELMVRTKAKELGMKTAPFRHIEQDADIEKIAREIVRTFSQPVIVRPIGIARDATIIGGFAPLYSAIQEAFAEGAYGVLVEEYIRGLRIAAEVMSDFRGEHEYVLPPAVFGELGYECPANISKEECEEIMRNARLMHRELLLPQYSRSDFVVAPRGIFYAGTVTYPVLSNGSPLPVALSAVGIPPVEFMSHLISRALSR